MNEKMFLAETVTPTAISGEASNHNRSRNLFVLGMVVLLLIALAVSQFQLAGGASVDSNSVVVAPASKSSSDEFAFYTERYWKMAEAREAEIATPVEDAAIAEPEYAYYTERYWKMAEAEAPAMEREDYAYYTERYWRQAEER